MTTDEEIRDLDQGMDCVAKVFVGLFVLGVGLAFVVIMAILALAQAL
jgi:hypothetical protein